MVNRYKKPIVWSALFLLLAQVLAMTVCNVSAIAVTEDQNKTDLFDNEYGKASIAYEQVDNQRVKWTVDLEKAAHEVPTRFMVEVTSGGQQITPENIQTSDQSEPKMSFETTSSTGEPLKLVAEPVTGSLSGTAKITFETAGNFEHVNVKPKLIVVDGTSDSQTEENLLADNPGVDIDFTKETQSTGTEETTETTETTTSTSESQSETTSTTATSESTESSEVDSSSVSSSSTTESTTESSSVASAFSAVPVTDPVDGGGLIIGENNFSDDTNMQIITNISGTEKATVKPGQTAYLNNIGLFRDHVRDVFLEGSSGHSIILPANQLANTKIKVFYDNVGYYSTSTSERHQVAAMIELTNIEYRRYGSDNSGKAAIQFSNNMYSGVSYLNIGSFNLAVTFYDATGFSANDLENFADGTYDQAAVNLPAINFSQSGKSVMSFASLNPSTKNANTLQSYEFAGARTKDGEMIAASSKGDLVDLNGGGIPDSAFLSTASKNTYFGDVVHHGSELNAWNGTNPPNGGDRLGLEKFWRTKVAFPLRGSTNYFVVGSTGGEAWNTFSSSAVSPVEQSAPVKTVQPLQALQEINGSYQWGGDSDGQHRYDNDLDRAWTLNAADRIPTHDPDSDSFLSDYLAQPEDRYLEKGDEFYYFINQKMINLFTESVILPDTISVTDTLPDVISFDENQIVVYDLHGAVFDKSNYTVTKNGQTVTVDFTKAGTKLLNKQSGAIYSDGSDKDPVYGGTVSVRIRAKVENTAPILTDIDNQASTTFNYTQTGTATKKQDSNKVTIQVKDKLSLSAEKIWDDADNQAGIRPEITLQLQRKLVTEKDYQDVADQKYVVEPDYTGEQLKHLFNNLDPVNEDGISYEYRVVEVSADAAFDLYQKDATFDQDSNTWKFTNSLKMTALNLLKTDTTTEHNPLAGAEFSLVRNKDKYLDKKDYGTVTTKSNGQLTFENLIEGSYTLTETVAPDGYTELADPITFKVVKDEAGNLVITELSENPLVSLSGNQLTVLNRLQTIKIKKIDSATNKPLDGAEFTLTDGKTDFKYQIVDGFFVFENLPQGNYTLTETKAPDGYRKLPEAITFTIGKNGEVTFTNNDKYLSDYQIVKSEGTDNNQITFNVKNDSKAPLPSTGGPGTLLFTLIGVLAVTAAGVYLFYRKDKEVA